MPIIQNLNYVSAFASSGWADVTLVLIGNMDSFLYTALGTDVLLVQLGKSMTWAMWDWDCALAGS